MILLTLILLSTAFVTWPYVPALFLITGFTSLLASAGCLYREHNAFATYFAIMTVYAFFRMFPLA